MRCSGLSSTACPPAPREGRDSDMQQGNVHAGLLVRESACTFQQCATMGAWSALRRFLLLGKPCTALPCSSVAARPGLFRSYHAVADCLLSRAWSDGKMRVATPCPGQGRRHDGTPRAARRTWTVERPPPTPTRPRNRTDAGPRSESNDSRRSRRTRRAVAENCGKISLSGDVDFLSFELDPATTKFNISFQEK